MKVNKALKKMASYNPTKQTFQMTIVSLNKAIESNEITLPLYQRDVSWDIKKAVSLLNYQLNGKAPVSPISMNRIKNIEECVPQIKLISREILLDTKQGQYSVTDGQQRLTTNYKSYIDHSDFRNVALDLVKGYFKVIQGAFKSYQIPVGILLNKDSDKFYNYMQGNSTLKNSEFFNTAVQIRSKLSDYNYTINLAEDLSEDEQIEWFEVLNNAGSRVSRVQMAFSKLKAHGIDIYNDYTKEYMKTIESYGYDLFEVKTTEVSIPIANLNPAYEVIKNIPHKLNYAPIPSDAKESQLCKLSSEDLSKCFSMTLSALSKALDFINDNNLKKPDRLDYITYLTGYYVFHESKNSNEYLINWYNSVVFSNKSNGQRRQIFSEMINK